MQPDEEHQAFALAIEDRSGGYPRHHRVDQDFVTTGEFRTLAASYQDVKDIRGPMIVKTTAAAPVDDSEPIDEARHGQRDRDRRRAARRGDEARRGAEERAEAPRRRRRTKDADVRIESIDELVEFFIAAGKKGVAINRYKGLAR